MCLFDYKRFRFTFKRIPVYKMVDEDNLTPFYKYRIKKYNYHFFMEGFPKRRRFYYFAFNGGFFHAYTNENDAKRKVDIENLFPCDGRVYKIIDGYIPAFTRYAIGLNGDICARRMILNV